jgi:hypothetical protein
MTIEERFERMERTHAEHVELARQDRAAHIAWKREMESQVKATWVAIERDAEENRKGFAESRKQFDEGMAEMRKEMAARDQIMDKRIADLVTAIGRLIQRMDER